MGWGAMGFEPHPNEQLAKQLTRRVEDEVRSEVHSEMESLRVELARAQDEARLARRQLKKAKRAQAASEARADRLEHLLISATSDENHSASVSSAPSKRASSSYRGSSAQPVCKRRRALIFVAASAYLRLVLMRVPVNEFGGVIPLVTRCALTFIVCTASIRAVIRWVSCEQEAPAQQKEHWETKLRRFIVQTAGRANDAVPFLAILGRHISQALNGRDLRATGRLIAYMFSVSELAKSWPFSIVNTLCLASAGVGAFGWCMHTPSVLEALRALRDSGWVLAIERLCASRPVCAGIISLSLLACSLSGPGKAFVAVALAESGVLGWLDADVMPRQ